jgi:hypothetical protein
MVDFNNMARGGLVKASVLRADGPILEGDAVRAVDPDEEDMSFEARVSAIEGRRVYLDVLWDTPRRTVTTKAFPSAYYWSGPSVWMHESIPSEEARPTKRPRRRELVLR